MRTTFLFLLLAFSGSIYSQEYYDIPRSRLSIELPDGFEHIKCTSYFSGKQHKKEHMRIFQSYGGNYYDHIKKYSTDPSRLGVSGLMAVEKEDYLKIAGYDARYVHYVFQDFYGLHSYELVFGDSTQTIQIILQVMINHINTDAKVEKILKGIKYDKKKEIEHFEDSGFEFKESKTFLIDNQFDPGLSTWRFLPVKRGKKLDRDKGFVVFSTDYFEDPISSRVVESQLTDFLYNKGFSLYQNDSSSTKHRL